MNSEMAYFTHQTSTSQKSQKSQPIVRMGTNQPLRGKKIQQIRHFWIKMFPESFSLYLQSFALISFHYFL